MIVQRLGKWTIQQAMEFGRASSPMAKFALQNPDVRKFLDLNFDCMFSLASSSTIKSLGEPLVRVRALESTPGLWVLDDEESGIVFAIWSDGYKKTPWKGTSIEVVVKPDQVGKLIDAFVRFYDHIVVSQKDLRQVDGEGGESIEKTEVLPMLTRPRHGKLTSALTRLHRQLFGARKINEVGDAQKVNRGSKKPRP